MKTLTSLALKFTSSFIVLYLILGLIFNMSLSSIILTTIVIGAISYIIGDLLILPRTNNVVATSIDFGLAFLLIWSIFSFGNADDNYRPLFFSSLFGGLGIALSEYLFHMFLNKVFFNTDEKINSRLASYNYAMETSEEIDPSLPKKED